MKVFNAVLAAAVLFGAPAFADSVIVQTPGTASVVSPPVAVAPVPTQERVIEKDTIQQSNDGIQREEKRTQEVVTPTGSSRTTVTTTNSN